MLTLLLFRHAKAERGGASDERRPLARRGREAADVMGRRLAMAGLMPDTVLCSPATRTLETLALASPHWTPAPRVSITPDLYQAMGDSYVDLIRSAPPARRLMLIAHNSATEDTALELVGAGDEAARARLEAGFPTAAIAVIEFDGHDWSAIGDGQGTLTAFLTPD